MNSGIEYMLINYLMNKEIIYFKKSCEETNILDLKVLENTTGDIIKKAKVIVLMQIFL